MFSSAFVCLFVRGITHKQSTFTKFVGKVAYGSRNKLQDFGGNSADNVTSGLGYGRGFTLNTA